MSDLRERAPAHALMEKLIEVRGEPGWRQLPLGILKPSREGLNWIRGIRGELHTARRLERLGPEWTVLHSVPVGTRGSDIDHLVVGPAGVFPINAKRHVDKKVSVSDHLIFVDGHRTDHVRNAAFEADRVEALLRRNRLVAPILPIVAISGTTKIRGGREVSWKGRRVGVIHVDKVVRRLQRRPARLTPADVARIAYVFQDSSSWGSAVVQPTDPVALRETFDAIDRGLTRWNILVFILLAAVLGPLGWAASTLLTGWVLSALAALTP